MAKRVKGVEYHYRMARKLVLAEVIRMARKILKEHDNLDEFFLVMGSWFFSTKKKRAAYAGGKPCSDTITDVDFKYLAPIGNLISEWDEYLKLTGEGIRFTATGKIVNDW